MNRMIRLAGLSLLLCLSTITAREPVTDQYSSSDNAVTVTIIYDNYQANALLETDWGFACLVEFEGNKLLFDAGMKADLYRKNVNLLEIHPENIPSLFISHEHDDHTAGIPWITKINPSVNCYLPSTYEAKLKAKNELPENSKGFAEPVHLYGPFYTTGDNFEAFNEQGLVIKTENGGVLITGCGHPGPVEMVEKIRDKLGIEVHTVIGGLHLMDTTEDKLDQISASLKKLGVKQICPTHCTGDKSIARLKELFGDGYIAGGTGQKIVIH